MTALSSQAIRQYLIVTGNYWGFTLTDGALRMLVVLHFHQLGYSALSIAMLFLFYEFFGVITNLVGGWLGARIGLNKTMNIGLSLQAAALLMLTLPSEFLSIPWVMAAQALSGIAKDLNKMSAKSSVKSLIQHGAEGTLFKWVAILTGSKNTLKGLGFFMGGLLLNLSGFQGAMWLMLSLISLVLVLSLILLNKELGVAKNKPKFTEIFSNSRAINILSAARLFLFASRDVWFVVALPVFLSEHFKWDFWQVGGFMALWIIAYGFIQTLAPVVTSRRDGKTPDGVSALSWAIALATVPLMIAQGYEQQSVLLGGLLIYGIFFAINSSLHSYLIISYAREDGASLDVGFYYMANAIGRLLGTVLSGLLFQFWGLEACLYLSATLIILTAVISIALPRDRSC
ncbi:organoarsenical effux MFS transporter ArsJ [uncultured Neptuniibacter sp.]|uniref:organoarsenical effux MFS transporter ArsJ n=1 Tax=uncultured Neptuniibacter sp. TaxID=502143 RepID=UPI002612E5E6|nr:organoarsenical effux MFS transporter ArsJ [uncultured Neptuniibacter sp.]